MASSGNSLTVEDMVPGKEVFLRTLTYNGKSAQPLTPWNWDVTRTKLLSSLYRDKRDMSTFQRPPQEGFVTYSLSFKACLSLAIAWSCLVPAASLFSPQNLSRRSNICLSSEMVSPASWFFSFKSWRIRIYKRRITEQWRSFPYFRD